MQQQELALKERDTSIKEAKTQADIAAEQRRLDIEEKRIASQERIAGAQIGAKAAESKANLDAKQMMEGAKMGMKAVSDERNREVQEDQLEHQGKQLEQNNLHKHMDFAAQAHAQEVQRAQAEAAKEEKPEEGETE